MVGNKVISTSRTSDIKSKHQAVGQACLIKCQVNVVPIMPDLTTAHPPPIRFNSEICMQGWELKSPNVQNTKGNRMTRNSSPLL